MLILSPFFCYLLACYFSIFLKIKFLKCGRFTVFCRFLLHSTGTQSHPRTHSSSHTVFRLVPSQVSGRSSLCCPVGLHCLSVLSVTVCITTSTDSQSSSSPLGDRRAVLHVCESAAVFLVGSFVLNSTCKQYPMEFAFLFLT